MAFRFVRSAGDVTEPATILLAASGVIHPGESVDCTPYDGQAAGGGVVHPSTSSSTQTMIFGVGLDYKQGASDTFLRVLPFDRSQLWEVDCANAATTAQLGIRHAFSASRGYIHNTATDIVLASDSNTNGLFHAFLMTGSTSGSGKLIGRFLRDDTIFAQGPTTFT